METKKIGVREFRENLSGYLEGGRPLAITRHAEVEAMQAAVQDLDAMIAAWGATEDELVAEYKEIHRVSREKTRDAK